MSKLQRYSYDLVLFGYDGARIEEYTDDDGDWVKSSDAEAALVERDARIKELEEEIKAIRSNNEELLEERFLLFNENARLRNLLITVSSEACMCGLRDLSRRIDTFLE